MGYCPVIGSVLDIALLQVVYWILPCYRLCTGYCPATGSVLVSAYWKRCFLNLFALYWGMLLLLVIYILDIYRLTATISSGLEDGVFVLVNVQLFFFVFFFDFKSRSAVILLHYETQTAETLQRFLFFCSIQAILR